MEKIAVAGLGYVGRTSTGAGVRISVELNTEIGSG
jgi:hypothetical protein